jgi:hypothetical protein
MLWDLTFNGFSHSVIAGGAETNWMMRKSLALPYPQPVYVTSDADPAPRVERVFLVDQRAGPGVFRREWGRPAPPRPHLLRPGPPGHGIRLGCGNVFTTGPHEQLQAPEGPLVCSGLQTPRRIIGLSILALGVFGLLVAMKLPAGADRHRSQYRQPYSQRRLLKRG